jgi:hypothetical protein
VWQTGLLVLRAKSGRLSRWWAGGGQQDRMPLLPSRSSSHMRGLKAHYSWATWRGLSMCDVEWGGTGQQLVTWTWPPDLAIPNREAQERFNTPTPTPYARRKKKAGFA